MGQLGFGFDLGASLQQKCEAVEEELFLDAEPRQLFIGAQRLEVYLSESGMGWVLRLAALLKDLDYSAFVRAYQPIGRRALHPRVMLGLVVYGIVNRQWSLGELEGLARRDVGAWWVCGGHQPDHSTIGKFIQLHSEILTEEFFVALVKHTFYSSCASGPGTVAGDGTVIEAAASNYRLLRAEAVVQPRKDGVWRPSYKPVAIVHEAGLIVGQRGEPSNERVAIEPMLGQHAAALGVLPVTMLLDAGCAGIPIFQLTAEAGIDLLCPTGRANRDDDWQRERRDRGFPKQAFRYVPERDVYQCPAGRELVFSHWGSSQGRRYGRYQGTRCNDCPLRAQCTTSSRGRGLNRDVGEELKEVMAEVLRQPAARAKYRRRAAIIEPVFAELRERQGLKRFHRRGLAAVRVEFALHCIAFNMKKVSAGLSFIRFILWFRPHRRPWRVLAMVRLRVPPS